MFKLFKKGVFKKYLFICGCGHSGTSIMLAIFNNAINTYAFKTETNFFSKTRNSSIEKFKNYASQKVRENYDLLVEKTPKHVLFCDEILKADDTEIIVMIRNPFDNVASLMKRGYDINQAIARYQKDNLSWQKFKSHKRFEYFRYEDMVNNFSETMKKLSNKFNLDLESANNTRLINKDIYFNNPKKKEIIPANTDGKGIDNHLMLRNFQLRQPIKNMNGTWLSLLSENDLQLIKNKLSFFIDEFNY